ncbi:hypothetical protein OG746_08165 [Streptomyces sp. NBC_01016]|uniref:hypothetical protein n=1 Tax=Streptomyces sp. NBC_01016 TaxID=2903720 RepID=UPI002259C5D7|nr:hypothetical protein [Streptomyces sp. NBC_01016]MCX4828699.1 hypothetical protein [Streptomyces sp. NBC_01016]
MGDFTGGLVIALLLFLLFIGACLFLSMWASPDLRVGDEFFRVGENKRLGTRLTGFAYSGDIANAAAVMYLVGVVAVAGGDGLFVALAAALSPLLMRQWLAKRLAGVGGRSFGETVARHLPPGPGRRAAGFAMLAATVPLLTAQFQPLGDTAQMVGITDLRTRQLLIVLMGALIVSCAAIGATRGATVLQMAKMAGLVIIAPLLGLLVLIRFGGSFGAIFDAADRQRSGSAGYLELGQLFGDGPVGFVDLAAFCLCVLTGAAFMPYLIARFTDAPKPADARRIAGVGFAVIGPMCAAAALIGFGAAALVPQEKLVAQGQFGGNIIARLAIALDGGEDGLGKWLLFVLCATFLMVLAAAAVLLLSAAASVVRDLSAGGAVAKPEGLKADGTTSVSAGRARLTMVTIGGVSILLAALTPDVSPQFWLILSYTVTTSTVLPLVIHGLRSDRPMSAAAMKRCVYGSTAAILVITFFSPSVSGTPYALFPDLDWNFWPFHSSVLVGAPVGFLLARPRRGDRPARGAAAAQERAEAPYATRAG